MTSKDTSKSSKAFNDGLNHGLSSTEDNAHLAAQSESYRKPLHSPDISGKDKSGYVPNRIFYAKQRVQELAGPIERMRDVRISRELEAGKMSRPLPWLFFIIVLVLFDGLLLGPIISNAIHSFKSQFLIFLVGIGVSLIIVAGGFAIGWAVRSVRPDGVGKAISAIIAAIVGMAVGYAIGWAGDGTTEGVLIRTALTGLSTLASAVFHYVHSESAEVWGSVRVARGQEQELINEQNSYLAEIDSYEENTIAKHEAFKLSEAERLEGYEAGKQGQRRWIKPNITNTLIMMLCMSLLMFSCSDFSHAEEKNTTIIIVDATDEHNREALAERVLLQAPLGYGQSVEVYLLGCNGLAPVFKASIKPINIPKHKQHLQEVKEKLSRVMLDEVKAFTDTTCSPIKTSLLLFAAEISMRQKNGEYLTLVVASDFESNRDSAKIDGQPFANVEVVAVMSTVSGKNLKRRKEALALIEKLFTGANLTITN